MKKLKKVLVSVLTFVMMASMISVFATGDGSASRYPGADSYNTGFDLQTNDTVGEYRTQTPPEHLFYVDGTPFILLDTDSDGNYFVMCQYTNGNNAEEWPLVIPEGAEDTYEVRKFNPSNDKNIAYTINSNIQKYVPSSEMRNQIKETEWNFAANVNDANASHTAACKLALPSVTEFKTYFDKIGFTADNLFPQVDCGMATRDLTYREDAGTDKYYPLRMGRFDKYAIFGADKSYNNKFGVVRPVFFLDKDFFKAARCDVDTLGADAKAEIKKYSLNDLVKTYSKEDLIALGYDEDAVDNAADRTLISGYPTADPYAAPYSGDWKIGNIGTAETVTPAANILKIGDKDYVYLDVDKDGNMFVMAKDVISKPTGFQPYTSDAAGDKKLYDASNDKSLAYEINSKDYIEKAVPDVTLQQYMMDYNWYTETNKDAPYSTKAKLAAPSATEIEKYYSKLGEWYTPFDMANGYTRTPSYKDGDIDGYKTIWVNSTEKNDAGGYNLQFNSNMTAAFQNIRPVFFIKKDYFKDIKLTDIENQGENVKRFIRASFSKSELSGQGYTPDELKKLGYAGKPNAKDVKASCAAYGAYSAGHTLNAEYTFVPDSDQNMAEKKDGVQYKWYISDTADGQYTEINGATSVEYTLKHEDIGKFIKAGVKTANYDETSDGYVLSNATPKIAKEADLIFESVTLCDAKGNIVTDINGENSLTVKFKINNTTSQSLEKYIILAVYDGDNVLKACNPENKEITVGEGEYSVSLDGFEAKNGWRASVMLWDDMISIKPWFGKIF